MLYFLFSCACNENGNETIIDYFIHDVAKYLDRRDVIVLFKTISSDVSCYIKKNNLFLMYAKIWGVPLYAHELGISESELKVIEIAANHHRTSREIANNIFSKSMDKSVKDWNILDRELFRYVLKDKDKLEEIRKLSTHKWQIANIDDYYEKQVYPKDLLFSWDNRNIIIQADVWEGKSTFLASLYLNYEKQLSIRWDSIILLNPDAIKFPLNKGYLLTNLKKNIFDKINGWGRLYILVDAFDEFPEDLKQDMKDLLNELSGSKDINIILSTRKTEFLEFWDSSFDSVWFAKLNRWKSRRFISERLELLISDENEIKMAKSQIYDFLNNASIDESLKNSPLMLYMLCMLWAKGELSLINNKAWLYEKIVNRLIVDHNTTKWDVLAEEYIESDIRALTEVAHSIFTWKPIKMTDARLKKLAILHRVPWGIWFDFIHKSFFEYFLAKYYNDNENWTEEILNKSTDIHRVKSWLNYPEISNEYWWGFLPVLMNYWEMKINCCDMSWLEKYLFWLLKEFNDESSTEKLMAYKCKKIFVSLMLMIDIEKNWKVFEWYNNIRDALIKQFNRFGFDEISILTPHIIKLNLDIQVLENWIIDDYIESLFSASVNYQRSVTDWIISLKSKKHIKSLIKRNYPLNLVYLRNLEILSIIWESLLEMFENWAWVFQYALEIWCNSEITRKSGQIIDTAIKKGSYKLAFDMSVWLARHWIKKYYDIAYDCVVYLSKNQYMKWIMILQNIKFPEKQKL